MTFNQWINKWQISQAAIDDLLQSVVSSGGTSGQSEAVTQQQVRMEHCQIGGRLWRNNCGAYTDERGVPVRYGLANESKKLNSHIKSSDLIGITPHIVAVEDVGQQLGIFTAIEVKKGNWRYTGSAREQAQLKFLLLVMSMGGIGKFSTGR